MQRVRDARAEDATAIAEVHVRAWQAAYRGLMPDEFLDRLDSQARAGRYTLGSRNPADPQTLLAIDEHERLLGFATIAPSVELAAHGELRALYVDPTYWRAGVGLALMEGCLARLDESGCDRAVLWLLLGNERAARFYRACGWAPDGARRREEPWGIEVEVERWARTL
jgi:GNAT superfamily N-acetyltransferase